MSFRRFHLSARHPASVLAISSVVLLGCARKVQIEVPASFHGHVQIQCTGLSDDRSITLHVDATGQATTATCPVRQTDTVVTRAGMAGPVETSVMWTTTGDGLVRQIAFDVR
jgi:hypothetical protein